MSQLTKNSTPWIMVSISMILLFLFVGYWNYATYTKEKKQLSDDVKIQLQLAHTEIKDSELILFIRTQLTDSITGQNFPDSISIFLDEHPMFPSFQKNKDGQIIDKIDRLRIGSDTTLVIDINLNERLIDHTKNIKEGKFRVIDASQINSVRFDENEDSIAGHSEFEYGVHQVNISSSSSKRLKDFHLFADSSYSSQWFNNDSNDVSIETILCDSNGFKLRTVQFNDNLHGKTHTSVAKTFELLKDKLIENNLPSNFSIVQNPESKKDGLRIRYIPNGFRFSEWIVDLKSYQLFIIKKMIPSLLFSLLLLGMIGLAFWTLLTNWIKQNRLVVVKNEFINNMTHELKTPIATVGVALEAISNFDLSQEQEKTKEYIEMSRSEINRLALLVDKVLNIAAFDSNNSAINSENVNLETTIQEIIQSMKLHLNEKNAKVDFFNNVKKPIISGDKIHLTNMVYNIIDNALKYSKESPKINISLAENQHHLILAFKDNGQGISKEYQNKIFDRFFRVPTDDKHDVKGHGLGLNYVQNIVHAHGGKISVKSVENQGTTFTVTLPKKTLNA